MPSSNDNKPPPSSTGGTAPQLSDEAWAAVKAIRAVVASLKETSTVQSVMRDYRAIEGDALPYRKFGFGTVEDFLRASGEFVIKSAPGETARIYIKPNRDSAHIQNMVAAQKTATGKAGPAVRRSSNFIAMRQPTTPALSGRGFGGAATHYSRNYQQLPNNSSYSGGGSSPKKVSFRVTLNGANQQQNPNNGGPRPITKTTGGGQQLPMNNSGTTKAGPTGPKSQKSSSPPETNNNNGTTKNYNLGSQQLPLNDLRHKIGEMRNANGGGGAAGAAGQQQQQQQQLPTNDLRHWLNERNGALSRSSVEMRQTHKALPLSTAAAAVGGRGLGKATASNGSGAGAATTTTVVRRLAFNVDDKSATKQPQQQPQQTQAKVAAATARKSSHETPPAQQVQQRNGNQVNSSNRSNERAAGSGRMIGSASATPPLPLMSIDVTPPSGGAPTKSVNSRLQIAKAVLPTSGGAAPATVTATAAPASFQRTQSLDERTPPYGATHNVAPARLSQPNNVMTYGGPTPQVSPMVHTPPPTLLGKKTLQDRLKLNQQLQEKDLERVAAKLGPAGTPKSPSALEQQPSTNATSYTPSSEQMSSFSPTTRPTSFTWSDPSATPVELLVKYSCYRGYVRPEYRYYRLKSGRIQCRVTLNGSTYSTYPADFGNEFEGQFAAALAAIEAIQRDESRQTYSVCLDADPEIAGAIHELLAGCPHGMFSKNVPDAYRAAHQALLPDHWFSIIDRYADRLFVLEEGPGDTIVFARDQPSSSDAGSNTSEARQMAMNQLALPWGEPYWNVYITSPVTTVEVWARLVGKEYSDKMDALITDIEISMLGSEPKADASGTSPAVGEYYLVSITDCWYRVRVDEINYETNQCQCFFIDIGEREQLALDQLVPCDPKYLQLPGQARCFTLDGLEDFSENPKAKHHLDALISGRVFIGEVLTKRDDFERAEQCAGAGTGTLRLMLYDTSSEYDVLLNPIILKHICDDTPVPELNRKTVNYVSITHVDDQGDVYCQKDGTMQYIQKLITNLTQSNTLGGEYRGLYKSKAADQQQQQQQLYLVQDESDGKWYRAALDAEESGPYCRMLYVDVGCRQRANVSNIYRLEMLSLALSRYPPQAIRMRMFELPGCGEHPSVLERLRAFLRPAMPAMAKVCALASATLPLVKVYVHVSSGGGEAGDKVLVCVNEAIKIERELEVGAELISKPRIGDGTGGVGSSDSDSSSAPSNGRSQSTAGGYSLSSADGLDLSIRFDGLNLSKRTSSSPASPSSPTSKWVEGTKGHNATPASGKTAIAKLAKMTLPPVGELFNVRVTIASSPKFFIVQPYAQAKQLEQLMRELQEFCMTKAQPVRKEQVRQGEAYAAFNRDGHWYRVVVVNIILFGPTPIHAYLCDFGLVAMLDVSNLRVLPPKLRVLPQQAVKAKLYGVKPVHKDWLTADAVRFQEMVKGRKFASLVRNVEADEFNRGEELVELELIDVSNKDDVYVHKLLVDEGRAVHSAEPHTV